MGRLNWAKATEEERERFISDAREYAARHPHGAVRKFVFTLAKALERCMRDNGRRAAS